MKRFCMVLMFVTSFCGSGTAQDLPPDILADQYLLEATKAMEEGKPQKAIAAFQKIEALDIEPTLELLSAVTAKLAEVKRREEAAKRETKRREEAAKALHVSLEMVWIAPGTFQMGCVSGKDCYFGEKPVHEVTISKGFYLGKYEVTEGQWEAVMGSNPSYYEGVDLPVENVSWNDVQEFIGHLNVAVGSELYRLPTEAEWEYACRAGTSTRWSFGNNESQLSDYAWYSDNNSPKGTKAVGGKLPNAWGLYDMHGNIREWVQDWYGKDYYRVSQSVDPMGPSSGAARVVRGGYFDNYARLVRSANRGYASPGSRAGDIGFRLLRRAN